ncbi:uncharacterized protein BKA78DRAFT_297016 [Phyllosticta capitalensis]|uniref:uncharacterized protein n=1 Tax=Phyllosticta capitalensis TaxID=121624 RepID=UPI0031309DFD
MVLVKNSTGHPVHQPQRHQVRDATANPQTTKIATQPPPFCPRSTVVGRSPKEQTYIPVPLYLELPNKRTNIPVPIYLEVPDTYCIKTTFRNIVGTLLWNFGFAALYNPPSTHAIASAVVVVIFLQYLDRVWCAYDGSNGAERLCPSISLSLVYLHAGMLLLLYAYLGQLV